MYLDVNLFICDGFFHSYKFGKDINLGLEIFSYV